MRSDRKALLFPDNMRDFVLVRRGIDLQQHFGTMERRKIVSVRYADGTRIEGYQYHCLGKRWTIRDITGELIRVALEM